MGNTQKYSFTETGRINTIADALNGMTKYSYDSLGNLLNITMAEGREKEMEYDKLNRVTMTFPQKTDP